MENRSENIKERIPADAGVGIVLKDDKGVEYKTVLSKTPREVEYQITSYKGLSVGAIHWYVTLRTEDCRQLVLSIPDVEKDSLGHKVGDVCWISGSFSKYMPEYSEGIRINVTRPVTDEEIRDPRWANFSYEPGDYTEGFNSYEEAQAAAKKEFKRIFGKGWKLVADRSNRGYKHL